MTFKSNIFWIILGITSHFHRLLNFRFHRFVYVTNNRLNNIDKYIWSVWVIMIIIIIAIFVRFCLLAHTLLFRTGKFMVCTLKWHVFVTYYPIIISKQILWLMFYTSLTHWSLVCCEAWMLLHINFISISSFAIKRKIIRKWTKGQKKKFQKNYVNKLNRKLRWNAEERSNYGRAVKNGVCRNHFSFVATTILSLTGDMILCLQSFW